MALKPPINQIKHAVIDVFSVNDGKLSVEQQIEVYGKDRNDSHASLSSL